VSGKASSFPKQRSTTRTPSEGSLCSYVGDGDPWDETSSEEGSGGEDLVREGCGGEASLDADEDPLVSTCERLIPLLSPNVNKWRERAKN
jgi:hypothetical protein